MTAEEWLISAGRVRRMERDLFLKLPTVDSVRALLQRRGWAETAPDVFCFEGVEVDLGHPLSAVMQALRSTLRI